MRSELTNDFLLKYGENPGSKIMANTNAFMHTETWGKMTPDLVEGYRKISKHVHINPYWWLFKIVDGFGAHMVSKKSIKLWYKAKIVMGKEEGDTSNIHQAYDDQVSNMDKIFSG